MNTVSECASIFRTGTDRSRAFSRAHTFPSTRYRQSHPRQTIKESGVRGLYRGHLATMMREVPGNIAWFGVYRTMCSVGPESAGKASF